MRIYMHTDMEGMAGLGDGRLIADRGSADFRRCAEIFWREVDTVARPFVIPRPSTVRWEFCRCSTADDAEGLPDVRRVGPREVEKVVDHAGYSILPGLLRCQAYPGETEHGGAKVIGPAGKLPAGTGF